MRIVVTTQIEENYGTAVNPFWKMKGGNSYCWEMPITSLSKIKDEVKKFQENTLLNNIGMIEYVIDWELEDY